MTEQSALKLLLIHCIQGILLKGKEGKGIYCGFLGIVLDGKVDFKK